MKYKEFMESHNDPSINVWRFICALILIIINVVGKSMKNDYYTEYLLRKTIESFYNMQYVQNYETADLFSRRLSTNTDDRVNMNINDLYEDQ